MPQMKREKSMYMDQSEHLSHVRYGPLLSTSVAVRVDMLNGLDDRSARRRPDEHLVAGVDALPLGPLGGLGST